MFIQLKTGHDTDKGPAWISWVRFNKSWKTASWHGKTLRRWPSMSDANFYDVETHEEYWLSGPHRDRTDTRYSNIRPEIDDDVRDARASRLRHCARLGQLYCPDFFVGRLTGRFRSILGKAAWGMTRQRKIWKAVDMPSMGGRDGEHAAAETVRVLTPYESADWLRDLGARCGNPT